MPRYEIEIRGFIVDEYRDRLYVSIQERPGTLFWLTTDGSLLSCEKHFQTDSCVFNSFRQVMSVVRRRFPNKKSVRIYTREHAFSPTRKRWRK